MHGCAILGSVRYGPRIRAVVRTHINLHGSISVGSKEEPIAMRRSGRMIVPSPGARCRQSTRVSLKIDSDQFYCPIDQGSIENELSGAIPNWNVAALAVKVGML